MRDVHRLTQRAKWWDQAAKFALLLGLLLPITGAVVLLQRGHGAAGAVLTVGVGCFLALFFLLTAVSLRLSARTYQETDPRYRKISVRAKIYGVFSVILMGPLLFFIGLLLLEMLTGS